MNASRMFYNVVYVVNNRWIVLLVIELQLALCTGHGVS